MRWFVEVSSIGDSSALDRLCVEGKQWQSALQEARRVRGDEGPLSKFSIEVLDDGYRAVNPALKLRYLVRPAPSDEPLSNGTSALAGSHSSTGATDSVVPPAEASPSALPQSPEASFDSVLVPADAVPSVGPSVPSAATTLPAPPSDPPPSVAENPAAAPPSVASAPPAPPAQATPASTIASALVSQRTDHPTAENPILYHEAAYSVAPGTSREEAEQVLLVRFQQICAELDRATSKKYVQLAIFDHHFEKRPLRVPLATLAWKEWRGAPVLGFPAFGEPAPPMSVVPRPSSETSSAASRPTPVSLPSLPDSSATSVSKPATESVRVLRSVPVGPAPSAPVAPAPSAPVAPVASAPVAPAPSVPESAAIPKPAPLPEIAEPAESAPSPPAEAAPSAPAEAAPSAPPESRAGSRRRAGVELLGALSERLDAMRFLDDIPEGSQLVLSTLRDLLPSEAIVIHVFDVEHQDLVVVRAFPDQPDVLLYRTSVDDELVSYVVGYAESVRFDDVAGDARFAGGLWRILGVTPRVAMCSLVRLDDRALGMIQLVNPEGGTPFQDGEAAGLDYVCQKFAEFVESRPIVLTRAVIAPGT